MSLTEKAKEAKALRTQRLASEEAQRTMLHTDEARRIAGAILEVDPAVVEVHYVNPYNTLLGMSAVVQVEECMFTVRIVRDQSGAPGDLIEYLRLENYNGLPVSYHASAPPLRSLAHLGDLLDMLTLVTNNPSNAPHYFQDKPRKA